MGPLYSRLVFFLSPFLFLALAKKVNPALHNICSKKAKEAKEATDPSGRTEPSGRTDPSGDLSCLGENSRATCVQSVANSVADFLRAARDAVIKQQQRDGGPAAAAKRLKERKYLDYRLAALAAHELEAPDLLKAEKNKRRREKYAAKRASKKPRVEGSS